MSRDIISNSLVQPHFDYVCISWYPLVSQKIKKIKVTQNKCIRFSLKLNSGQYIGAKEFKVTNWLPTKKESRTTGYRGSFKYWKRTSPFYLNELFGTYRNTYKTKSNLAWEIRLRKSKVGQQSMFFSWGGGEGTICLE